VSALFGFGAGALGGVFSAVRELELIDRASLVSAVRTAPHMFAMFGLMAGGSSYLILYRVTSSIHPLPSAGTR